MPTLFVGKARCIVGYSHNFGLMMPVSMPHRCIWWGPVLIWMGHQLLLETDDHFHLSSHLHLRSEMARLWSGRNHKKVGAVAEGWWGLCFLQIYLQVTTTENPVSSAPNLRTSLRRCEKMLTTCEALLFKTNLSVQRAKLKKSRGKRTKAWTGNPIDLKRSIP